jgi:hypothetical protein
VPDSLIGDDLNDGIVLRLLLALWLPGTSSSLESGMTIGLSFLLPLLWAQPSPFGPTVRRRFRTISCSVIELSEGERLPDELCGLLPISAGW